MSSCEQKRHFAANAAGCSRPIWVISPNSLLQFHHLIKGDARMFAASDPVISSKVEVSKAGWPMAAAQLSSNRQV